MKLTEEQISKVCTKLEISSKQLENLITLANYLLKTRTKHFDMYRFTSHTYNDTIFFNKLLKNGVPELECGTIGCAVGHGPLAGIPWNNASDWRNYAITNFNLKEYFNYCFGSNWKQYDNTPQGAGKRIFKLIEYALDNAVIDMLEKSHYQKYKKYSL